MPLEFCNSARGLVFMTAGQFVRRAALIALLPAAGLSAGVTAAVAGDCNADIGALSQTRQSFIEKLNVLAKASKGKLDPLASCAPLQGLVKAEGALLKYLESNNKWCNIPDETVASLRAGAAKSVGFATQACNFAAQAKKQQQQQASGGGLNAPEAQKLPTGPL
ncbi:hypothetical protein [Beijerinckia sp. L45]|uniref:hypothetical protein n=1 Tax=Beijerinckia sp. L45 TaxID=1641855 RepID=UPI001FED4EF2|nr:hypothetical protein [Beijerinckia sp. L45]